MNFFTISDRGLVRPNNEDYLEALQLRWSGPLGSHKRISAVILADGMGGAAAGEFASMLAVNTTKKKIIEGIMLQSPEELLNSDHGEFLKKCFVEANSAIWKRSREEPDLDGMGTTIVTAFIVEDQMTLAHVGDSRAYMLREGKFKQVTRDHSLVQELLDQGRINAEQARSHPNRNVITRALGVSPEVEVETQKMVLYQKDLILLCSDGLSGFAEDVSISKICRDHMEEPRPDLVSLGNKLIELAKFGGGGDNVSVGLYCHL